MTESDYLSKIAQADRLMNDPEVTMDAALIWRLMDEISGVCDKPADQLVSLHSEA